MKCIEVTVTLAVEDGATPIVTAVTIRNFVHGAIADRYLDDSFRVLEASAMSHEDAKLVMTALRQLALRAATSELCERASALAEQVEGRLAAWSDGTNGAFPVKP